MWYKHIGFQICLGFGGESTEGVDSWVEREEEGLNLQRFGWRESVRLDNDIRMGGEREFCRNNETLETETLENAIIVFSEQILGRFMR